MKLFPKFLSKKINPIIDINKDATIADLKKLIEEQTNISVEKQRLILAGEIMKNHRSINYYNLCGETAFHVVEIMN